MRGKTTHSWKGMRRLLCDVFPGEEPCDDLAESGVENTLKMAFAHLNFRQIFILIRRYQLDGGDKEHTLEEVAEMVGRSKENVRQHESKALRKLRHPSSRLYQYMRRS